MRNANFSVRSEVFGRHAGPAHQGLWRVPPLVDPSAFFFFPGGVRKYWERRYREIGEENTFC